MNKLIRDSIFVAFIIIFIILATISCLYAAGYKFNLTKPWRASTIIQKTGLISVSTSPRQAQVFIDNKLAKSSYISFLNRKQFTTPLKIRYLLPGEYLIRLEKKGYWPIERRIMVHSGQVSHLDGVNLFRYELPLLLFEQTDFSEFLLFNTDNTLLYLDTKKVLHTKTNQINDLNLSDKNIVFDDNEEKEGVSNKIFWLKANKLFIDGEIYDLDKANLSNSMIDPEVLFPVKNDRGKIAWFYHEAEDRIYYHQDKNIYQLSADWQSSLEILKVRDVLDFYIWQNDIFLIKSTEKGPYLEKYDLKTKELLEKFALPSFGDYNFIELKNKYLSLYDSLEKNLYLIDLSNWQKSILIRSVNNWDWINNKQILYNNDWEIYVFSLNDRSSNLILRWGEKIQSVVWNNKKSYYLFSTNKSINIYDLKANNILNILSADKISPINLDYKNNLLYFYAELNEDDYQPGIYKMITQ